MSGDEMRAGDADRQVVADRLRSALDEGRLDLHEYDERLQRTYAAKTYGQLDALLCDLPATMPPQHAQVVPAAAPALSDSAAEMAYSVRSGAVARWLLDVWLTYLGVVGIVMAFWAITGSGDAFWPAWVAGPWGVVLLWHTVEGLHKGEPHRWAAKQERKARRAAGGSDPGEPSPAA